MKNQNNLNRGLAAFAALALAALAVPNVSADDALLLTGCPAWVIQAADTTQPTEPVPVGGVMAGTLTAINDQQAFVFAYPQNPTADTISYTVENRLAPSGLMPSIYALHPVTQTCNSVTLDENSAFTPSHESPDQVIYVFGFEASGLTGISHADYAVSVLPLSI